MLDRVKGIDMEEYMEHLWVPHSSEGLETEKWEIIVGKVDGGGEVAKDGIKKAVRNHEWFWTGWQTKAHGPNPAHCLFL